MYKKTVKKGTVLKKPSETGREYYLVQKGKIEVYICFYSLNFLCKKSVILQIIRMEEEKTESDKPEYEMMENGSFIDAVTLFFEKRSKVHIRAVTDSVVWALHRSDLRKILIAQTETELIRRIAFLRNVFIFQPLTDLELYRINDSFKENTFSFAQTIIKQV